jgi:hypothetical protein
MMNLARPKVLGAASKHSAAEERQRAIGAQLRQMYDDVLREPVPEEFLRLLEEAERAERAAAESDLSRNAPESEPALAGENDPTRDPSLRESPEESSEGRDVG